MHGKHRPTSRVARFRSSSQAQRSSTLRPNRGRRDPRRVCATRWVKRPAVSPRPRRRPAGANSPAPRRPAFFRTKPSPAPLRFPADNRSAPARPLPPQHRQARCDRWPASQTASVCPAAGSGRPAFSPPSTLRSRQPAPPVGIAGDEDRGKCRTTSPAFGRRPSRQSRWRSSPVSETRRTAAGSPARRQSPATHRPPRTHSRSEWQIGRLRPSESPAASVPMRSTPRSSAVCSSSPPVRARVSRAAESVRSTAKSLRPASRATER